MEVIRIGEFNAKALEKIMEIQPFETALYIANNKRNNFACLKRLDYLLAWFQHFPPRIRFINLVRAFGLKKHFRARS